MELKPGYKRTELGVIPEDWTISRIYDLCECSSGTTPARALHDRYYRNGSIPWVKTMDLNNGAINATSECVTETAIEETCLKIFPAGTVLVAMYGGFQQIGRTGLLQIAAAVNQAITAIRIHSDQLLSEYLHATLNHRVSYWRAIASSSRKDPNITRNDVRSFPIAYPTAAEQNNIGVALSDVDSLLERLERLITKKRDLKQAAVQQLLTGQTRLPGFTGEWEVKALGDLFDFSGGYSASRDQLSTEGHCYLHYGDIHGATKTFVDTATDYSNIPKLDLPLSKVSPKSLLQDGDVVFVDASEDDEGTSRHIVVVNKGNLPFISGLHTIVAKSKTDEINLEYRRFCFQTKAIRDQFRFYAVGTKVSGISKTNIPRLTMPVPSLDEQAAIATVLTDMDAELVALEQRLAKDRDLKQAMMQELLTGKTRLVTSEAIHA